MPLDVRLANRFAALFHNYGSGGAQAVEQIKEKISYRDDIREDGKYFLLVNLDQMVIQPLSGLIPNMSPSRPGQVMDRYEAPGDAAARANDALDIILNEANPDEKGQITANEIARVIVGHAATIGNVILWWREP